MKALNNQYFRILLRNIVFKFIPDIFLPNKIKILKSWYLVNERIELRVTYQLTEKSIVFDLGGYEGQWAEDICRLFACSIYIFEPVSKYAEQIRNRFLNKSNIYVYEFGLAGKDSTQTIYVDEESSSIFKKGGLSQEMKLVDINNFVMSQKINHIDLMKINIEGGEYELLEKIVTTDLVNKISNLQIQFHDFVEGAEVRREAIQKILGRTHKMTYCFPFIWENWQLIK